MKYQITCDNCGTQFIINAGEGETIECQCPHCKGLMEITLPVVSAGEEFDAQRNNVASSTSQPSSTTPQKDRTVFYGVIIGLFVVAIAVAAYFVWLKPADAPEPDPNAAITDTIPYQIEQEVVPVETIDTMVRPEIPQEEKKDTIKHNAPVQEVVVDTATIG